MNSNNQQPYRRQNSQERRSTRQAPPPPPPPPTSKNKKKFAWWTIPVIVICLSLLVVAWVYADGKLDQYDEFSAMRNAVSADVIHGAVTIDGVNVSGMTLEDARAALDTQNQAQAQAFEVNLTAGEHTWRISNDEIPMEWDTESLLHKAYQIGRAGSLEDRYASVQGAGDAVALTSEFTYDRAAVRERMNIIAQRLTIEPIDAAVVAFDVKNRSFAFSEDTPGQAVDVDALYSMVIERLDGGRYGETIEVPVVPVEPSVTKAELERDFQRIASYKTETTSDSNRNTNIDLAAQALNGKMIPAGETISFNETTGERLAEKGYLPAGAIENGRSVQEYGGGVCQVSTTLFNAMVRADCEIVSRKPHAWPSDYVPRGEDAAVDWPGLDLILRNKSEAPMFITAWYEDQSITVEVYGLSLGDGVSIELESKTTYTKEPTEVLYTYNEKLPVGTQPTLLRKPRTGYAVQTYKIWQRDGEEISREAFYTSDYRMINEEYEYNDGNPPIVVETY